MTTENKSISEEKLTAFMTKAAADFGATWSSVLVNIGDKLGLYKEVSRSGPISSEELANRTGTADARSTLVCVPASLAQNWPHLVHKAERPN